ncbi:DUF2155 domain-containing protein [Bosea sp. (in: a-proteobacteria)]|uniref:DUF2155 domain-containing protein n=1 Tax=Bosea sp. (in: a-proteobacteria) TaxID=1871050 RepID=UPI0026102714|nr:DUF2155 domain-containing protein [Bosea sp. (in: a-proteobacteria)]MCO5093424.1 DUF2155 domain-containing protein [Bosea sp. (in: a-proteobacteria)]
MPSLSRFPILAGLAASALALVAAGPAEADRIKNPTAVFAGLDKITGRIISFEVAIDETVQFGALQLTPRVCWTRPPTEAPQTDAFVEVDEVTVKNEYRRIFTGWMYAASPGLHGVEHAIYDVWLTDCKGGSELVIDPKEPEAPPPEEPRRPRTPPREAAPPRPAPPPGGRIDVEPPRGVPVQPQRPSQRFFPTNPVLPRDPTGSGA